MLAQCTLDKSPKRRTVEKDSTVDRLFHTVCLQSGQENRPKHSRVQCSAGHYCYSGHCTDRVHSGKLCLVMFGLHCGSKGTKSVL